MPKRKRKKTSIYISNELENAMHDFNWRVSINLNPLLYMYIYKKSYLKFTYIPLIITIEKEHS